MKDADIATAIRDTLISPNVMDSNLEAANLVDVLASIARAINAHAEAIRELANALDKVRQ